MSFQSVENQFNVIMQSDLFRLDGPKIDLCKELQALVVEIQQTEDPDCRLWSIGEFLECSLDNLIIGAYWALTEWHAGQYSPEYATLCKIGEIFSPGMSSLDLDNSGEAFAYEQVSDYFSQQLSKPRDFPEESGKP